MAETKEMHETSQAGTPATERNTGRTGEVSRTRGDGGSLQGSAPYGEYDLQRLRDPFAMIQRLSKEMDQLFDSFFYGTPQLKPGRESALRHLWAPDVEVCEEQNQLRVLVDLPGVDKNSVKIDVHEGLLTIQGERREERTEGSEKEGYRRSERRYGSFYRTIPLPEGAKTDDAQAQMKEGVLEIIVPTTPRRQARRLEIKG